MESMNLLLASGWHYFFGILMFLTSLFLILLVLVQRGRGGGLAGAFGGMGGQSAFGTKAGDLFTRLTMGAATFWIILCVLAISVLNRQDSVFGDAGDGPPAVLESLGTDAMDGANSTIPPGGSQLLGSDPLGSDTLGSDPLGSDTLGSDTLGSDTVGSGGTPEPSVTGQAGSAATPGADGAATSAADGNSGDAPTGDNE